MTLDEKLEKVNVEEIFINLSSREKDKAKEWYEHLKPIEQKRIYDTLKLLLQKRLYLDSDHGDKQTQFAIIVAGTSIDKSKYKDIDLFLLTENSLATTNTFDRSSHPGTEFQMQMRKTKWPECVFVVDYNNQIHEPLEVGNEQETLVTISLFYELHGFDKRRKRHPDDLLLDDGDLGLSAENMMHYNKAVGSKFVLLSRQY